MSDVTLSVGGRHYTVACAEGDEERVKGLAAMIDDTLAGLGARLNTPMEAKNLLIAGLILADQLDEARKGATSMPSGKTGGDAEATAKNLEQIADRLEKAAEQLEQAVPNA